MKPNQFLAAKILPLLLILIWICSFGLRNASAQTPSGVVEVFLFWEAGCEACEKVLQETIPPLQARYSSQLKLNQIELTTLEDIDELYRIGAAYGLDKGQIGVPMLVVGETILVGSDQISSQFPGLLDAYITSGGIQTVLRDPQDSPSSPLEAEEPLWNGMPLAWGLMVLMLIALGYTIWQVSLAFQGKPAQPLSTWLNRSVPILALLGLGVAGYMYYIEATYTPAICGPVGDCNAVQTSPYARILGVIPVGLLGVAGYLGILAAWLWRQLRHDRWGNLMPIAILGMTVFGTSFSIYLTYLEIFVIRAVCIWCLSSALIITLSMLASLPAALSWLVETEEQE